MPPLYLAHRGAGTDDATRAVEPLENRDAPKERPLHGASGPGVSPRLSDPDRLETNELGFKFRITVLQKHLDHFTEILLNLVEG